MFQFWTVKPVHTDIIWFFSFNSIAVKQTHNRVAIWTVKYEFLNRNSVFGFLNPMYQILSLKNTCKYTDEGYFA